MASLLAVSPRPPLNRQIRCQPARAGHVFQCGDLGCIVIVCADRCGGDGWIQQRVAVAHGRPFFPACVVCCRGVCGWGCFGHKPQQPVVARF